MRRLPVAAVVLSLAIVIASAPPAWSQAGFALDEAGRAQIHGDFRHRAESDWASRRADGTHAADRHRLRIRLRLGLDWNAAKPLSAGVRVRSGSRYSQQSPHITYKDLNGNPTGDQDMLLDKYFLQVRRGNARVWMGRNDLPLWKQNELFWDDDVTPAGVGASYRFSFDGERSSLTLNGGSSLLPDGGVRFSGGLHMGQAVYASRRARWDYTAAAAVARFEGSEGFRHLRTGNGARDYTIWIANLQARGDVHGRPLTLGFDLLHNSEDYSRATDAFTAANRDRKDGFVASAHWGATSRRHDWQAGYYFAWIEKFAVNASYAQDDWERWGSATQNDSSDLRGHELRFTYVPVKRTTVVARLYVTETMTSLQRSRRFRVDLNHRF